MASESNEITTFTFTPDNPCNTTITSAAGDVLYRVSTEHGKRTVVHVHNTNGEEIASLVWRETLSDEVIIGGEQPRSFSDWLKKSHIPFKEEVSFKDEQNRKYKWKGIGPGRSFDLYSEDDKFHASIARYTRTYRKPTPVDPETGKPGSFHTPGELALLARALEIQDLVVLTLLFQEKQFRVKYGNPMGEGTMLGMGMGALGVVAATAF